LTTFSLSSIQVKNFALDDSNQANDAQFIYHSLVALPSREQKKYKMAEEDAEIALLHQLQAGQDSVAWEEGANIAADGELSSNTEDNNQDVKKNTVADDQVLRAFSPSDSGAVSDGGDYDPSSVTSIPAVTVAGEEQSRSSSVASSRKPKKVGGFIADDSDEDSDESSVQISTGLQPAVSNNLNRTISPSPLQMSVTPQDVRTPTENQAGSQHGLLSSTTLSVNPSVAGASPSVQAPSTQTLTSAAPSAHLQAASVPKARLPHDKTGILEDRIKEDPRGDLDAWLSLIAEHRKRNKIDEARAVYDRFFKVFPQAVRVLEIPLKHILTRGRLKYGLNIVNWNSKMTTSMAPKEYSAGL
jgi:cleavage stimulation factor subunit 3